jgi:hypothetical protein
MLTVTGRAKSDVLLNNMCEVFNGKLVEGRDRPIISALEYIREYLMRRIVTVNGIIAKCDGPLTPTATKLLKGLCHQAADYIVSWNENHLYQVTGPYFDQKVVNMATRTCSCRYWELTGLPCKHAIAVNWNMAQNNMNPGLVEEWVNPCYRLDTWREVYSFSVNPINDPSLWPKYPIQETMLPPDHHPQPGRPNKKRKRSAGELIDMVKNGKMSRGLKTVTCVLCHQKGHNKRTCTGQSSVPKQTKQPVKKPTSQPATKAKHPASATTQAKKPANRANQPATQPKKPASNAKQPTTQAKKPAGSGRVKHMAKKKNK